MKVNEETKQRLQHFLSAIITELKDSVIITVDRHNSLYVGVVIVLLLFLHEVHCTCLPLHCIHYFGHSKEPCSNKWHDMYELYKLYTIKVIKYLLKVNLHI